MPTAVNDLTSPQAEAMDRSGDVIIPHPLWDLHVSAPVHSCVFVFLGSGLGDVDAPKQVFDSQEREF